MWRGPRSGDHLTDPDESAGEDAMTIAKRALLLAAALSAAVLPVVGCGPAGGSPSGAVVRTDTGAIRGTVAPDHRVFLGIPYAAAPVGKLRWAAPAPVQPWKNVRDATEPGSACPQAGGFPGDPPSFDEDCLYLNVTTPRDSRDHRLPVMVWIHGGGFFSGSGAEYGAARMAVEGGVVVVTLNYRLGALGFIDDPALGGASAGNFGLADQEAALRWVRRNAAAFGGDPGNVTLFGESAGGVSTCSLLSAPGAAGLFQRAIVQSGPCGLNWPYTPTWGPIDDASARAYARTVERQLGCGDRNTVVACMTSKPAKVFADLFNADDVFSPVYGTATLPQKPSTAVATGSFSRVPVMTGVTRDEFRTFEEQFEELAGHPTPAQYSASLSQTFGSGAAAVLARYPLKNYVNAGEAFSAVVTDWGLACPTLTMESALSRHVPTYAYEFADEAAPWFRGQNKPDFPTGAYHAGELQYLFDGAYDAGTLTAEQRGLAHQMIRYWTDFARTGNPNGTGLPAWRPTGSAATSVEALAPDSQGGIHPVDFSRQHQCGFWRGMPGAGGS